MINPLKMGEMLSQANQMQEEVQRKLAQTVVEGSAGGGAVNVTMNGKKQLLKMRIDPSAVTSLSGGQADVEMLEDLIVAAVNDAGHKQTTQFSPACRECSADSSYRGLVEALLLWSRQNRFAF